MNKILLYILILFIIISCTSKKSSEMIIINATIYTVDGLFSQAEAMAVSGGRIVETGTTSDIFRKYKSKDMLDLSGCFVYPGFIDAHCHFYGYGQSLNNADLTGTDSFEDILEIIKSHAGKVSGEWITGRGWDQNRWKDKRFPDKSALDSVFPERPVLLVRIDGHAALVNSAALRMSGIDKTSRVEGGDFLKNEKGELTGVLIDNAINVVRKIIPRPSQAEIESDLLQAQTECFSVGLTSIHDAGLSSNVIEAIHKLNNEGKLQMRIYGMLDPSHDNLEKYLKKGPFKTEYVHIRSVKLFADGALGSRGALLTEPYADDSENTGLYLSAESYLREICELADKYEYQVCTHCIGDGANRLMLNMYGDILKGRNDKRWRIEHAQVIHPDDFPLFGKFSVIPSIQTTHATSDMYWAKDRLGPERVKYAYAYKQLLEENGWLPNGSDFPVESINPLFGFYAAFARKDHSGFPDGGFQAENALTREEALRAMTIWAAKAAFEECEKGSLESGKFADFVVLDRDIMKVDEKEVLDANVLMTVSGGETVYKKVEWNP